MNLTRRKAVACFAAAAAAPALSLPTAPTHAAGELATLISRYFAEVEAFNLAPDADDEDFFARAAATFQVTLRQIVGVPVRTSGDALAAIDWILADGKDCMIDLNHGPYGAATASLLKEVRRYIASTANLV